MIKSSKFNLVILIIILILFTICVSSITLVINKIVNEKKLEVANNKKVQLSSDEQKNFDGVYINSKRYIKLDNGNATICYWNSCTYPKYDYINKNKISFSDNNNYYTSCTLTCSSPKSLYYVKSLECEIANNEKDYLYKVLDVVSKEYILCNEDEEQNKTDDKIDNENEPIINKADASENINKINKTIINTKEYISFDCGKSYTIKSIAKKFNINYTYLLKMYELDDENEVLPNATRIYIPILWVFSSVDKKIRDEFDSVKYINICSKENDMCKITSFNIILNDGNIIKTNINHLDDINNYPNLKDKFKKQGVYYLDGTNNFTPFK